MANLFQVVVSIGLQERDFVMVAIAGPSRLARIPFVRISSHILIDMPDSQPTLWNVRLKTDGLPPPFDVTPIQPFDGPTLDAVDAELRAGLGDRLLTPDDVRGSAPDLHTAISTVGWPTVHDARGKVMFFLDNEGLRDAYLVGHPSLQGRVLFTSSGEGQPDGAVLKVNEGTANADTLWQCTNNATITIGSTNLVFAAIAAPQATVGRFCSSIRSPGRPICGRY